MSLRGLFKPQLFLGWPLVLIFPSKSNKKKIKGLTCSIQLFRERLSEKVQSAIPKSIVGGFEFTVFQRLVT